MVALAAALEPPGMRGAPGPAVTNVPGAVGTADDGTRVAAALPPSPGSIGARGRGGAESRVLRGVVPPMLPGCGLRAVSGAASTSPAGVAVAARGLPIDARESTLAAADETGFSALTAALGLGLAEATAPVAPPSNA